MDWLKPCLSTSATHVDHLRRQMEAIIYHASTSIRSGTFVPIFKRRSAKSPKIEVRNDKMYPTHSFGKIIRVWPRSVTLIPEWAFTSARRKRYIQWTYSLGSEDVSQQNTIERSPRCSRPASRHSIQYSTTYCTFLSRMLIFSKKWRYRIMYTLCYSKWTSFQSTSPKLPVSHSKHNAQGTSIESIHLHTKFVRP